MPGASLQLSAHLLQLLLWIGYFALHSYLATPACKARVAQRWPRWHAHYRLIYNGLALFLLVPVLALVHAVPGPLLWDRPAGVDWLFNAAALVALVAAWRSGRAYDLRVLLGLPDTPNREPLGLSPLHRYVRHPWYACGLLILWTRPLDVAMLVTAVAATVYLVIGARREDAKLVATYGEPYARYRARVPGLWPIPGRVLSAPEAEQLLRDANRSSEPNPRGVPTDRPEPAPDAPHAPSDRPDLAS